MFKGRYNHLVDGKGRISLPARFRESLVDKTYSGETHVAETHNDKKKSAGSEVADSNDRVVLTYALDAKFPHIDVFPFLKWAEFEEKVAAKPMFDDNIEQLKRLYIASAQECQIDSHGRILIPQRLRENAGIKKDAVWVGMTRTIELWQPAIWDAAEAEALSQIVNVRKGLAGFDL